MKYLVHTQFFHGGKWLGASDRRGVDTIEAGHAKGLELIAEQRRDFHSGIVSVTSADIPRRYVIAEVIHISDVC